MKVNYISFGCKVNSIEIEAIRQMLDEMGIHECEKGDVPDWCVINSCSVTATAESKVRRAVRSLASRFPKSKIAIVGCYATRSQAELKSLPNVVCVLSNTDKLAVVEVISGKHPTTYGHWAPILKQSALSRGFIKVQDGCCGNCSYCIVSKLRGAPVSRPLNEILEEIIRLCDDKVPEIVLAGVNLGAWGFEYGDSFDTLLNAIASQNPSSRIRLSSIEPQFLTTSVIDKIAAHPHVFCNHLHVPLQSGSNTVLQSMNRGYTNAAFLKLIDHARSKIAHLGLTTDIIVGYPTEGNCEFADTLALARDAGFHRIHAFSYSPRKGTDAFCLGDPVNGDVKRDRINQLLEVAKDNLHLFVMSLHGKPLDVVFESDRNTRRYQEGYSSEYLRILSTKKQFDPGTITRVVSYRLEKELILVTE